MINIHKCGKMWINTIHAMLPIEEKVEVINNQGVALKRQTYFMMIANPCQQGRNPLQ